MLIIFDSSVSSPLFSLEVQQRTLISDLWFSLVQSYWKHLSAMPTRLRCIKTNISKDLSTSAVTLLWQACLLSSNPKSQSNVHYLNQHWRSSYRHLNTGQTFSDRRMKLLFHSSQKPTSKLAASAFKYCDWMKVLAASLRVEFCHKWKRALSIRMNGK